MDPEPKPDNPQSGIEDDVFVEATELPESQREAFVHERCGGDPRLVQSVLALLAQFDRLGSFLDVPASAPLVTEAVFKPDTILADRFRLHGQIGSGGMGVVYLADDLALGEPVALKMIRELWVDDSGALARFHEEIRLARKIAHSNICRTYELFTDYFDGRKRVFFTMERLEGKTLAEMLRSGWRPSPAEILAVAREVAAGLDAAHDIGIVHRDLKPGNIMMAGIRSGSEIPDRCRPVIMDFGLAQALANPGGSLTRTGQIAGSPDYMAPEQFLSERITPAADVFSLAVIVYEMATGGKPWPDGSIIQLALRRVSGERFSIDCGPGMPSEWNRILSGAITRNPTRRPQRASDLVRELEKRPSGIRRLQNHRLHFTRRSLLLGGGVTALSGLFGFLRFHNRDGLLLADPALMLTPVKHPIGYGDSKALNYLIERQLQQSAHIRLVGATRAQLPEQFTAVQARKAALFAGARYVVLSSVSRPADEYRLDLEIEELRMGPERAWKTVPKQFVARDENALIAVTRDVCEWIRRTLRESSGDIAARTYAPEELATDNWRALQEFLAADEAWRDGQQGPRAQESIRDLRTALNIDSGFALAAARLGDRLVSIGQEDEGLKFQQQGIRLMDQRNLKDRESLRLRGSYYQDTGQDEIAENLYLEWGDRYKDDALPRFYRSTSLMRLGRQDEAWKLRAVAAKMDTGSYAIQQGAAMALLEAGKLGAAEAACSRLRPGDETDQTLSGIAFGRYDGVATSNAILRLKTLGSPPYQCKGHAFSACLLAEQGRWQEAEQAAAQGIERALEASLPQSALGIKFIRIQLLLQLQRGKEAKEECDRILVEPDNGVLRRLKVGCLVARAGYVQAAQSCASGESARDPKTKPWLTTPHIVHWEKRLAAEIELAKGNKKAASRKLTECPPPLTIDEWPEYKVRVLLAAGAMESARLLISSLFENPGRYWYQADVTGPGFFRWAIKQSERYNLFSKEYQPLLLLKNALNIRR